MLEAFDPAAAAGGPGRTVIHDFPGVWITDDLTVRFEAVRGAPLLSGIEIIEDE